MKYWILPKRFLVLTQSFVKHISKLSVWGYCMTLMRLFTYRYCAAGFEIRFDTRYRSRPASVILLEVFLHPRNLPR
jgi:hypothetical protein